ncbi:tetratricopeptide repeat (TPR)-containing protein [Actinidia rufa]|uniref:Tetratricopeptide repeat (TPR)-containing protein n=1 Tax=Actinidia rufa TaxID=165716 RepID=A0A7J0FZN0_9ERIC|nr:tetratricopeptide repeat (TPR)-containing protein [Actinidia rufa]
MYGVPSLFTDLSPLYDHPGKADILEGLILELEHSIRTTGGYPGRSEKELPSTLLWALCYLAQHYDRRGQYDIALEKIEEAIKHTPTLIDLYSVKGRILKHAGDLVAAAALADEARCMDLADRYINSECVKRMLQADQVALAEKTAVLFTKDGDQHNNLHDMQCMWCYIKLYDSPSKSAAEEDDEMSKLPASQKKKMRQKQRKAEARAKKEAEVKNEESNVGVVSKSGKRHVKTVDPDPNGEKLLQVEDPLLEATKYLKLLQKHSPDSLETHLLSFELNMRKQRILLAFQAVKQLLRLDAENPDSHRCLIRFFHKLGAMSAPVTDTEKLIWAVLEAERPTLSQLHEKSLIEANTHFLEKHKDSLMHRAAVAEMLFVLDPSKKSQAIKLLEDSSNNLVSTTGALGPVREWKLKDCIAIHRLFGTTLDDRDAALRWKVRCAEYYPCSTYFEGSRSSAIPNSAYNQICKNPENGGATHLDAGHSVGSVSLNGKVENLEASFKDIIV